MDWLFQIDYSIFRYINHDIQNPFFDYLMPILRDKYTWIPIYFFFVFFAFFNYKWKEALLMIGMTFVVFAIADSVSSVVVKEFFQRPRPCHLDSEVVARLLVNCGGGFSFTSSHATNHMAISVFLSLAMFRRSKLAISLLITWALSVSVAQVYVGVHYPLDVTSGMILGSIIAIAVYYIYEYLASLLDKSKND